MPLRPLGLGELLDGAIKIVRRYPKPTLGVSAVIAAVGIVLNVLVILGSDYSAVVGDAAAGADDPLASSDFRAVDAAQILTILLQMLFGLVLTGALISVVGKAVLGRQAELGETWAEVRGRLWALLGLALLTLLIGFGAAVGGFLLAVLLFAVAGPVSLVLGIPAALAGMVAGAYLYVRLSLAPAALVLEKTGIRQAMRRSGVLVRRSWWRVFGITLLTAFLGGILANILAAPFLIIGIIGIFQAESGGGFVAFAILTQVGAGLASVIVAPWQSGVSALLYVDRRMRAEGLDLTLQAAAATPSPA